MGICWGGFFIWVLAWSWQLTSDSSKSGTVGQMLELAEIVLLKAPTLAQRHNRPPSPLTFFIVHIISIIPESFEILKILSPKNAFAPVWNQPGAFRGRTSRNPTAPKWNFQNSLGCLGQLPWREITSFGDLFGCLGGPRGVLRGHFGRFQIYWEISFWRNFFLSTYAHLDAVLLAQGCQYILVLRI